MSLRKLSFTIDQDSQGTYRGIDVPQAFQAAQQNPGCDNKGGGA